MKRLFALFILIVASLGWHSALAYTATTTASVTVNLRAAPSSKARVLTRIAPSARFTVSGCAGGWCRARVSGRLGYVRSTLVRRLAPTRSLITRAPSTARSSGRGYTNSAGVRIASPTFADTRPEGASARCRDGSYSFSASRRGTCSHHGGVAEWY